MSEVNGLDFYDRVTSNTKQSEEYTLVHDSGAEFTLELEEVNRKFVLDEINRLPDGMLEALSEADDEDEAQEMAEERNMLTNVNGNTILAFENICVESMNDPSGELTSHQFEDIVQNLSFEALFEMGSIIIENSIGDTGSIKDFHRVDSDKSS